MFKIITLLGTRPEIIKMSSVISKLNKNFNHVVVHSGQNYDYELNKIFFEDLDIKKPKHFLNVADKSLSKTIGNIIYKFDKILEKEKPDAIVIYGDTNTSLGIIPAKRKKIPIFHLEAGNRCFDERVPEELNRKIADHLSDINMVISDHARNNLIREGIKPETIFKIGSNMKEVIEKNKKKILNSKILNKLRLIKNKYFLISLHREENVDTEKKLSNIIRGLSEIQKKYKTKKIIVSLHPRTKNRMKKFKISKNNKISYLKPFCFSDYINLQLNAFCTISDSGTIFEESSILKIPSVTIRSANERPEGMENGVVVQSDANYKNLLNAIKISVNNFDNKNFNVNDYNFDNVSDKVVKIISSHISYVNEKVWFNNHN
tara:strand:+ start:422 stop:1546 length:1125 start_codon:yes stop_codon:yes gene_type:complete